MLVKRCHFGITRMSARLFGPGSSDGTDRDAVPERKYGLMHAIYLTAIVVATIGWLCLIAWIGMWLI